MDTNLKALKDLYVSLGGAESDVADLTASSQVIPLIKNVAGGAKLTKIEAVSKVTKTITQKITSLGRSDFEYYDQNNEEVVINDLDFDWAFVSNCRVSQNFFDAGLTLLGASFVLGILGDLSGVDATFECSNTGTSISPGDVEATLILVKNVFLNFLFFRSFFCSEKNLVHIFNN